MVHLFHLTLGTDLSFQCWCGVTSKVTGEGTFTSPGGQRRRTAHLGYWNKFPSCWSVLPAICLRQRSLGRNGILAVLGLEPLSLRQAVLLALLLASLLVLVWGEGGLSLLQGIDAEGPLGSSCLCWTAVAQAGWVRDSM